MRRVRSRSLSVEFERGKESTSPIRPRLRKEAGPRPDSTISRDSLCDSLYEPKFSIPSATKLRREKLARVCKLLGDDVPIDLVFPANDDPAEEDWYILDICAPQEIETPPSSPLPPTPPKPQRKPAVPPKPEQPRWLAYRTPTLETIVEQSPRSSSYSSISSADSACSLLTTTTSSSYRFTSSGCASESSTASILAHESPSAPHAQPPPPPPKFVDEQIHEMSGTHGRREFAIYVPFRRRTNRLTCQAELGKGSNGQFEVVRGMLDLRI